DGRSPAPPSHGRHGAGRARRLRGGRGVRGAHRAGRGGASPRHPLAAAGGVEPLGGARVAGGDPGAVRVDAARGLHPRRRLHAAGAGDAALPAGGRVAPLAGREERHAAVLAELRPDDRGHGVLSRDRLRGGVRGVRGAGGAGDDGGLPPPPGRGVPRARHPHRPPLPVDHGGAERGDAADERRPFRRLPPPPAAVERARPLARRRGDGGLRGRGVAGGARLAAAAQRRPACGLSRRVPGRRAPPGAGPPLARPLVRLVRRRALAAHRRARRRPAAGRVPPALGRRGDAGEDLWRAAGGAAPLRPAPGAAGGGALGHPPLARRHRRHPLRRRRDARVHRRLRPGHAARRGAGRPPGGRSAAARALPGPPRRLAPAAPPGGLAALGHGLAAGAGAGGGAPPAHLHLHAGASPLPRADLAGVLPVPPPRGALRVLLHRHGRAAARAGHPRAQRDGLPGRGLERARRLPARHRERRALVGGGVVPRRGVGALRPHAPLALRGGAARHGGGVGQPPAHLVRRRGVPLVPLGDRLQPGPPARRLPRRGRSLLPRPRLVARAHARRHPRLPRRRRSRRGAVGRARRRAGR
ncbi:MAG: FIG001454: Transglutaminase-like enzymes, putative cysteine proteases, partial [uncultured Gemmatimonadetes bacterium]